VFSERWPSSSLQTEEVVGVALEVEDRERGAKRVNVRVDAGAVGDAADDPPDDAVVAVAGRPLQVALRRDEVVVRRRQYLAARDRGVEDDAELVGDGLPDRLAPFSRNRIVPVARS
jgi:hypothetical protein